MKVLGEAKAPFGFLLYSGAICFPSICRDIGREHWANPRRSVRPSLITARSLAVSCLAEVRRVRAKNALQMAMFRACGLWAMDVISPGPSEGARMRK